MFETPANEAYSPSVTVAQPEPSPLGATPSALTE